MKFVVEPAEFFLGGEEAAIFVSVFNLDVLEALGVGEHPSLEFGLLVLSVCVCVCVGE
jgi:hypothetical protein